MYTENPPATGSRLASAAKVSASGNDSRHKTAQATIDAGPAVSAATAGRTRIPVPSTAPVYRATAVRRPMVRSSCTFIRRVGLICSGPRVQPGSEMAPRSDPGPLASVMR